MMGHHRGPIIVPDSVTIQSDVSGLAIFQPHQDSTTI